MPKRRHDHAATETDASASAPNSRAAVRGVQIFAGPRSVVRACFGARHEIGREEIVGRGLLDLRRRGAWIFPEVMGFGTVIQNVSFLIPSKQMSATSSSGANATSWPAALARSRNSVRLSRPSFGGAPGRSYRSGRFAPGRQIPVLSMPGVRVEGYRSDALTLAPSLAQLAPQALGECRHRGLRGGVDRAVDHRCESAVAGRGVHDVAFDVLGDDRRHERVDAVDHTHHVHVEGPPPVVHVVLPDISFRPGTDARRCCTPRAQHRTRRAWHHAMLRRTRAT